MQKITMVDFKNKGFILAVTLIGVITLSAVAGALSYDSWNELSRHEKIERAAVYTIVNFHAGRPFVVHPEYGFEIPLCLAIDCEAVPDG